MGRTLELGLVPLAVVCFGCAAQLPLVERTAVAGGPLLAFWPPPEATGTWHGPPSALSMEAPVRAEADRVLGVLRRAGYDDVHGYAVGADFAHGFAVTTKLERIEEDGRLEPSPDRRWSPMYPEAANVFWLEGARRPRLPGPGRYRVLLVAFTDLPMGRTNRAPVWNRETWMADGDDAPLSGLPTSRHPSPGYELGAYVYEYMSDADDGQGTFVAEDATAVTTQLARAGLSQLTRPAAPP